MPFLRDHFKIKQHSFWSEKANKILYFNGNRIPKTIGFINGFFRRSIHLFSCINADFVFIHREAVPIGFRGFEWIIAKIFRKPIVFDFDDAIWHLDTSEENKGFEWLKNPKKTEGIIKLSSMIFAGNNYLANYAKHFNKNVAIIPTTIDTNYHLSKESNNDPQICIGWTGSTTTVKHFELIVPVLIIIKEKYPNVYFKLIGDEHYANNSLNLKGTKWKQDTEITDLQELDIGIMPLPNDEWAQGKCGFKGLQYMALGIPAIMSPVGVNTEIIQDGINGYIAHSDIEWVDKLSRLIESKELRTKLGKEGRRTVVENYSVNSQKANYLEFFKTLVQS